MCRSSSQVSAISTQVCHCKPKQGEGLTKVRTYPHAGQHQFRKTRSIRLRLTNLLKIGLDSARARQAKGQTQGPHLPPYRPASWSQIASIIQKMDEQDLKPITVVTGRGTQTGQSQVSDNVPRQGGNLKEKPKESRPDGVLLRDPTCLPGPEPVLFS